jgi:hypothetical protein
VNFIESFTATDTNDKNITNLVDFLKRDYKQIVAIIGLNFLMLLFGFLAELGIMDKGLAFVLGFGALCGSFGIIWSNYGKHSEKTRGIFWVMFGLWAMYGLAFLFPPVAKNVGYTALDIFAKNFFGILLFYNIRSKSL